MLSGMAWTANPDHIQRMFVPTMVVGIQTARRDLLAAAGAFLGFDEFAVPHGVSDARSGAVLDRIVRPRFANRMRAASASANACATRRVMPARCASFDMEGFGWLVEFADRAEHKYRRSKPLTIAQQTRRRRALSPFPSRPAAPRLEHILGVLAEPVLRI